LITATVVAQLHRNGELEAVIDFAVNGTDGNSFLGWYPDGDADLTNDPGAMDRNVVAAAFQMLGQEIADNAHPLAAYPIILEVITLRNAAIQLMKDIPQ
jgi:hypothetical protein